MQPTSALPTKQPTTLPDDPVAVTMCGTAAELTPALTQQLSATYPGADEPEQTSLTLSNAEFAEWLSSLTPAENYVEVCTPKRAHIDCGALSVRKTARTICCARQ